MLRYSFNDGWTAGPKPSAFGGTVVSGVRGAVQLPHDGVRDLARSADSPNGSHTGFYPSVHLSYEKTFLAPEEWRQKTVLLEFEGVYRDAMVFINDELAGQRPNGYTAFEVQLDAFLRFGELNSIRVESRTHEDSRWYTGGGIYRNTWLAISEPVHLTLSGVRVTTPDIEPERAVVVADLDVINETRHSRTVRVRTRIAGPDGAEVACSSAPITLLPAQTGTVHVRHYVERPELWNVDDPKLYVLRTSVEDGVDLLDEDVTEFGIRQIQLDPINGLRINGQAIKLRGGCVHHDNGPPGSAAIDRAEERRVEILKAAGYNAVRSAHNNISRAFLEACDRHGMLVMDELSDVWTQGKSAFDYSTAFPEWWERDVESMVAKDYNHPSVIMYSIGNEIFEVGRPIGSVWGRRLAEKVRALDPTRLVTNAINGMVAALDLVEAPNADPVDVNAMIASWEEGMDTLGSSEAVSQRTEEAHSQIDVSGINYAESRYAIDADARPDRILVGSETFPGALDRLWTLVKKYPSVLGDFAWTAWDYLGEAGIGRVVYTDENEGSFAAAYPHLLAETGTIDITGRLRPIVFWRQIVWGLRSTPYIAVHRPQRHGQHVKIGPWAWHDVVDSWTWDVDPGSPITVDVYSDADEVELLLNGSSVARASVGDSKAFIARLETTYEPGTLTAIAFRSGEEVGRTTLATASGDLRLNASPDRTVLRSDGTDLAYVEISIGDGHGTVANDLSREIHVTLEGPAQLAGFTSAAPSTEERFDSDRRSTYDGRVLAVVRPVGQGTIVLTASADGFSSVEVVLNAGQASDSDVVNTEQPARSWGNRMADSGGQD